MLLRALFFGIFYFCVSEFFYYLIRSGGTGMFIVRIFLVVGNVDNYDKFCYFNKSVIVSKAKEIIQHLYGL
jgi:hypothetical protein